MASARAYFTCSKLIYSFVDLSMLSSQLDFDSYLRSGSLFTGQVMISAMISSLRLVELSSLCIGS